MANQEYPLERRVNILASKLTARGEMLSQALAPSGSRPPFHEQLSRPAALQWWRQHRYSALGKKVLENMQPEAILELDQALAQANEVQPFGVDNGP